MAFKIDQFKMQQVDRLELVREQTGMNQSDFAKFLDLEPGSYSDVKRGKNGVSRNVLRTLEKKLNVNIEWLLTGIGEMRTKPVEGEVKTNVETLIPYKLQSGEGVNSYIDRLFLIIERRDAQIEKLMQALRDRDQLDKESTTKILSYLEKMR
jgi:transcriptional regulator with XRE-family HTH domain